MWFFQTCGLAGTGKLGAHLYGGTLNVLVLPLIPLHRGCPWRRAVAHLELEALEARTLPSVTLGSVLPAIAGTDANDTLDRAVDLGSLSTTSTLQDHALIGDGSAGAADVDWYRFTLEHTATVTLTSSRVEGSSLVSVLTLFRSYAFDPLDLGSAISNFSDPQNALSYQRLAQVDGTAQGGSAQLEKSLAAGTYYVAISGAGNSFFYPFLEGSGYAGSTGNFQLELHAIDLGLQPGDGPVVLGVNPDAHAVLDRAPLLLRVELSSALSLGSIDLNHNVQLLLNATGVFGNGSDQLVPLAGSHLVPGANELQLVPAAPLAAGFYRLFLAGNSAAGQPGLAGVAGTPLGADASQPQGDDYVAQFQIAGLEGNPGADANSTPATAHALGDLAHAGLVQVAGAIGDDPTDPVPYNPADVDWYHFQVSGSGRYGLSAEVFAARFGAPLNPALNLFRQDAATGQFQEIAANDDTDNDLLASNGLRPLLTDSVLFAGLTEGDYYLVVSATDNPAFAGPGDYVLNVLLESDNVAPQVVSVTPGDGAILDEPPSRLLVQFSEPVNLNELARQAFNQIDQGRLDAAYIQAANGTRYFPRLYRFDAGTNVATFHMYDRLPNGSYEFHLSGAGSDGITDRAGNRLTGNISQGDHVTPFSVNGPAVGASGNVQLWVAQEPNNDPSQPQELGVLFPEELAAGVTVVRDFSANPAQAPADAADYFAFQVLQRKDYIITLTGSGLPAGVTLELFDESGAGQTLIAVGAGGLFFVRLDGGRYILRVGGWSPAEAGGVTYQLGIRIRQAREELPPPLTIGAAPAIRFRVLGGGPPVGAPPPPLAPSSGSPTILLPSGPIGPPANTSRDLLEFASIPTGVLFAMGARSAGAAGDAPATGLSPRSDVLERVFAQSPEILLRDQLLKLTVLTQAPGSGSGDSSSLAESAAGRNEAPTEETVSVLRTTPGDSVTAAWERAVELLHYLWNMVEPPAADLHHDRLEQAPETDAPGDEDEEHAVAAPPGLLDTASAHVLILTTALASALPGRPFRNRPGTLSLPRERESTEQKGAQP